MTTPLRIGFLLTLCMLVLSATVQAQCVPDTTVPANPGIYPDPLVPAEGCEFYDEVITFSFPRDTTTVFAGQTITVNFITFTVDSIVGLPDGMDWECNLAPGCTYVVHPDSANADTIGCIRLFGTPTIPATYNISVAVTAVVDLFGNPNPNPTTFDELLVVTPCAFEGDCYTLNLSSNCEPSMLEITNNIPSNGNPGFSYDWSLTGPGGFSYQTSDEDPFDQMLAEGGDYIMDFSLDVDTVGFVLNGATIEAVSCSDPLDAPDIYWIVKDPSGVEIINTSSNTLSNTSPPINMGITGLLLDTGQYEIQVWDFDTGLGGADDGCATGAGGGGASLFFSIPPAQTGPFTYTSGGLQIELIIDNPIQTITCSDTFRVEPLPDEPTYMVEGQDLTNDSAYYCEGSFVMLETGSTDSLLWYKDGDLIPGSFSDTLHVNENGLYYVEAIDRTTFCRISGANIWVDSVVVPAPMLSFDSAAATVAVTNVQPGLTYTFFSEDSTFEPITDIAFKPEENGVYYAVAFDPETGCSSLDSEPLEVTSIVGIEEKPSLSRVEVFPNPSQGAITLSVSLTQAEALHVQVLDLAGRSLMQQQLGRMSGKQEISLQLESLAKGAYLLVVSTPTQRMPTLIRIE